MWVSQSKALLSCSNRYLHVSLSALSILLPAWICSPLSLQSLPAQFLLLGTVLSFAGSVPWSELSWYNREQPLVCGSSLLRLQGGVSCSVARLSEAESHPVLLPLLARARARAGTAPVAGELP